MLATMIEAIGESCSQACQRPAKGAEELCIVQDLHEILEPDPLRGCRAYPRQGGVGETNIEGPESGAEHKHSDDQERGGHKVDTKTQSPAPDVFMGGCSHLQWLHPLLLNLHNPTPQPEMDHGQRSMLCP